jgi:hypothetical protein
VTTITGYLDRARQTGNYPGLPTIPAGARLYDKVPVTRQGGPVASPPRGGPAQVQITVPASGAPGMGSRKTPLIIIAIGPA